MCPCLWKTPGLKSRDFGRAAARRGRKQRGCWARADGCEFGSPSRSLAQFVLHPMLNSRKFSPAACVWPQEFDGAVNGF